MNFNMFETSGRYAMSFALALLFALTLSAQVGINRVPTNSTFVVGNDTISPSDTLMTILSDSNWVLLQVDADGHIRMPHLDTGNNNNLFLTQDSLGNLVVRELSMDFLDGDDEDWVKDSAVLWNHGDSSVIIHRGATLDPILEIKAPSVGGASETFFKASMDLAPNDYFVIGTGTSANTRLYPYLKSHVEDGYGYVMGMSAETISALDSGTTPMMVFDARKHLSRIFNRPLFQWTSYQATWMTMTADGYLGIGLVDPTCQLEITGSAKKPGGGDWLATSDRRLKEGIRSFDDGLDALMKIRPVRFRYNGKAGTPTDREYVGIIAQEMEEIAPYTISSFDHLNEDGTTETYLEYDGNATTYIMINAIQEQQELIQAQENKIAHLEDLLGKMEAMLGNVEGEMEVELAKVNSRVEALLNHVSEGSMVNSNQHGK